MNAMHAIARGGRALRATGAIALALAAVACTHAPDMASVAAERAKSVRRTDSFQAVAVGNKIWVAGGSAGQIDTSTDGGRSWQRTLLPGPASVLALTACADGSFAALDFYHKVWTAPAEAKDWTPHELAGDFNPLAIACDPRGRLWVVGSYATIVSSEDHGASWHANKLNKDVILTAVHFIDAERGFVLGEFGSFYATEDGGANWQARAPLTDDFYPYAVLFSDALTGWVSGLAGVVMQTNDGGKTWNKTVTPGGVALFALAKVGGDVIGFGEGGRVLALRGEDWIAAVDGPATAPVDLVAATPIGGGSVLLAGAAGTLQSVPLLVSPNTAAMPMAQNGGAP